MSLDNLWLLGQCIPSNQTDTSSSQAAVLIGDRSSRLLQTIRGGDAIDPEICGRWRVGSPAPRPLINSGIQCIIQNPYNPDLTKRSGGGGAKKHGRLGDVSGHRAEPSGLGGM